MGTKKTKPPQFLSTRDSFSLLQLDCGILLGIEKRQKPYVFMWTYPVFSAVRDIYSTCLHIKFRNTLKSACECIQRVTPLKKREAS